MCSRMQRRHLRSAEMSAVRPNRRWKSALLLTSHQTLRRFILFLLRHSSTTSFYARDCTKSGDHATNYDKHFISFHVLTYLLFTYLHGRLTEDTGHVSSPLHGVFSSSGFVQSSMRTVKNGAGLNCCIRFLHSLYTYVSTIWAIHSCLCICIKLYSTLWVKKTALFYFCNNFVKPRSILIIFGIRVLQ